MTLAIDYSFTTPDPAAIVAAGISGVLVYTGPARPDKATIDQLRAHGLTVCLVQESDPNRSQQGFDAGVADAQYANARALEVDYPADCSICYVVSDGDAGNPNSGAAAISEYARGVASYGFRPRFYYGNRYATDAARAGDPEALGAWLPSTWGANATDLLVQEANMVSPIADTDLDTVQHPYGAWGADTGDDVTPEQMATIGQWLKDTEARINAHTDAQVDKKIGQWFKDSEGRIEAHGDATWKK